MIELPQGPNQDISVPLGDISQDKARPLSPREGLIKWRPHSINEDLSFRGGSSPVRSELKIILWSWVAATIDGLLLIALSSLFLISFALVMRLGFEVYLIKQMGSLNVIKIYIGIFAVASWLYLITMRAFLGCSIGEKICDLRLGTPLDRISNLYIFRVILRNSLVLMTGIVVIPLLSIFFARDLAGKISGLSLFSIK